MSVVFCTLLHRGRRPNIHARCTVKQTKESFLELCNTYYTYSWTRVERLVEISPQRFTMTTVSRYSLFPSRPAAIVNEWLLFTERVSEQPLKWCIPSAVCLSVLRGRIVKLLPSRLTLQRCTSLQYHFIRSRLRRVLVCLAVVWRLHFWQNDRDLLRATVTFTVAS